MHQRAGHPGPASGPAAPGIDARPRPSGDARRPAGVVRRHQLAERRPYLIVAGLCALLCLVAWWLYLLQGTKIMVAATQALMEPNKIPQLQKYEKLIETAS